MADILKIFGGGGGTPPLLTGTNTLASNTTNATIALPATASAGDLAIVCIGCMDNGVAPHPGLDSNFPTSAIFTTTITFRSPASGAWEGMVMTAFIGFLRSADVGANVGIVAAGATLAPGGFPWAVIARTYKSSGFESWVSGEVNTGNGGGSFTPPRIAADSAGQLAVSFLFANSQATSTYPNSSIVADSAGRLGGDQVSTAQAGIGGYSRMFSMDWVLAVTGTTEQGSTLSCSSANGSLGGITVLLNHQ